MFTFVLVIHIIICIVLVFMVLLQAGKGAQLGAAFGGMGQNTVATPETALQRLITYFAVAFVISSLALAFFSQGNTSSSVLEAADQQKIEQLLEKEAAPGGTETPAVTPSESVPANVPAN